MSRRQYLIRDLGPSGRLRISDVGRRLRIRRGENKLAAAQPAGKVPDLFSLPRAREDIWTDSLTSDDGGDDPLLFPGQRN